MCHSRVAAASWQLRGLLQQQQETWHFECIVPMSTMHFRDVILMGLCSGRMALARLGNFLHLPGQTWHQRSDNWLHLCKSVSVLLVRVFCLVSMSFFFIYLFFYTAWLSLCFTLRPIEKVPQLPSRQICPLLTPTITVTGRTQWQQKSGFQVAHSIHPRNKNIKIKICKLSYRN